MSRHTAVRWPLRLATVWCSRIISTSIESPKRGTMNPQNTLIGCAVLIGALVCLTEARAQDKATVAIVPDKVLVNGTIVTMAREGDVAEAIAIRGSKIVAVGTTKEIRA